MQSWHDAARDPESEAASRKSDVVERILFWAALAAAAWLVVLPFVGWTGDRDASEPDASG